MSRCVLVAGKDRLALGRLPDQIRDLDTGLEIDLALTLDESVLKAGTREYGLALCCVDGLSDLESVRRIRGLRPMLPIVIVPSAGGVAEGQAHCPGGPTIWVPDVSQVESHIRRFLNLRQSRPGTRRTPLGARRRSETDLRSLVRPPFVPLLVEDDPDSALLLLRAFEKAAVRGPISVVTSGEEAMAYLSGRPPFDDRQKYPEPTIVILDLRLPGCSGFDVLTWVRRESRWPKLPVVILSSSTDVREIERAYAERVNSYLVKPIAFEDLVQLVRVLHFYWTSVNVPP